MSKPKSTNAPDQAFMTPAEKVARFRALVEEIDELEQNEKDRAEALKDLRKTIDLKKRELCAEIRGGDGLFDGEHGDRF